MIVNCAIMLHNCIRRNQSAEDDFDQPLDEEDDKCTKACYQRASCSYAGQHCTANVGGLHPTQVAARPVSLTKQLLTNFSDRSFRSLVEE